MTLIFAPVFFFQPTHSFLRSCDAQWTHPLWVLLTPICTLVFYLLLSAWHWFGHFWHFCFSDLRGGWSCGTPISDRRSIQCPKKARAREGDFRDVSYKKGRISNFIISFGALSLFHILYTQSIMRFLKNNKSRFWERREHHILHHIIFGLRFRFYRFGFGWLLATWYMASLLKIIR